MVLHHLAKRVQRALLYAELRQLLPPAQVEYVEKQPSLEDVFFAVTGKE